VYGAYGRLVYAVAHRTLGSRELAEEATQQTFVQGLASRVELRSRARAGTVAGTIARRTAIDLHRREARRPVAELSDAVLNDQVVVDMPPGVDRAYDVWAVREAIDALPDDERTIVQLQHLHDLTQSEVAERLGIPIGTVKSRSYRAHRTLAARLQHLRDVVE
jgi:RNA polymerase sigma-70 factor (ECF subfamily)